MTAADDRYGVVATVETIKRAWSGSGGIRAALGYVTTRDNARFTVLSRGGKAMNALLGLNPGDVARFTGRFSRPFDAVPNIELSQVAVIERSGKAESWLEQWSFVSTDRLSPDFRRRVAGLKLPKGLCAACDGPIETADQIAQVMLRGDSAGMVCLHCGALPSDELAARLSVFKAEELEAELIANGLKAECAIALCCGLDPDVVVDWSVDSEWDYGLRAVRPRDERVAGLPAGLAENTDQLKLRYLGRFRVTSPVRRQMI
jgi:hypothetical protein